MTANPWSKFFWNDWDTDPNLRLCSMAAQGLWMRLLCMAARGGGKVLLNGRQPTPEHLARLYGETPENIVAWLDELEWNGVFSRDRHGTIYSRRMLRDAKKSKTARDNGKLGGNPTLCKNKENSASDNPRVNPRVNPLSGNTNSHKPEAISHKPAAARNQKPEARSSSQEPVSASPDPSPPSARSTARVPSTSAPPAARNAAADPIEVGNRVLDIVGADPARWTGDFASVRAWLSWGADPDLDIYPAVRQVLCRQRQRLGNAAWRPNRLSYFDAAVEEARLNRIKPPPAVDGGSQVPPAPPVEDDERWRRRMEYHLTELPEILDKRGPLPWDRENWGPSPGEPGCRVPPHILDRYRARLDAAAVGAREQKPKLRVV